MISTGPLKDLPDLKGKVIIVTGGNAGIGFATVQHLARLGAKVYLAARNEGRATAAISRLQAEGLGPGNGEVLWLKLDLSDPRVAKQSAEDFMKSESRLDVLGESPRLRTHSHIGPFIFTQTLLPLLIQTASQPGADVRIVNLTSGGHVMIKGDTHFLTLDDMNKDFEDTFFPRMSRYAYSKLANVLFTRELQKHVDAAGAPIIVTSVHPGFVGSETHVNFWKSYHMGWFPRLVCTPPSEGAYNSVFAAVSPVVRSKPAEFRGAYLMPVGKISKPSKLAQSDELAKELWDTTERVLKDLGV
ncbi:hypothetical protein JAAARDRAFT_182313 [Jaapia argillacea MUCL 33604]|uniref:NAD(P)-binding protein n=1 Tax=Jaapia argillacea MUCL 33604 TaxID=933084 RepID=A0A067PHF6_9AGAM|nr:hypothetical protein JAAARDRAFT_182313 [Jaapia argillacea MUCL 33604]